MHKVKLADVRNAVMSHFGLTTAELIGDGRAVMLTQPRQLAMLLCSEMTGQNMSAIGRFFGNRDHSTVLHAIKVTRERIASDGSWRAHYTVLVADIHERTAVPFRVPMADDMGHALSW